MGINVLLEGREGREAALDLIRSSTRVFMAYAHSDLRQARNLLKRFRRVRAGRPQDSIFLDQVSLAPAG